MRRREHGAALIMALLIVSMAALLLAGLAYREQVQIRRIEAERLKAQANSVERGAIDYARLILRSSADSSPSVDYLGQVWSLPLERTRLSDFLSQIGEARAEQGEATYLTGFIEDAQGRFNLRNLVHGAGSGLVIDPLSLAAYGRLLAELGLPVTLAAQTAQFIQSSAGVSLLANSGQALAVGSSAGSEEQASSPLAGPVPPRSVNDLADIPGVNPGMIARLAPFVTILPVNTPVNINTTSAEVLAAVVPGLPLSSAQYVVAARNQAYLRNTADLQNLIHTAGVTLPDANTIAVRSNFFIVHAQVQHERAEISRDILIYRTPLSPASTRIISSQERF